jgi:two-component system, cell cycle sensor histidine kinase and response regulator CckA
LKVDILEDKMINANSFVREVVECEESHLEHTERTGEHGPETILVVEDEAALLDFVEVFLRDAGFNVLTATNGREATDSYLTHSADIDLVLTDMGLPSLCGKGLLSKLRQINPDARIILSSGYFDPELKSEMLRAGANAFVTKPFVPEDMLKTVRSVLDSGR